MISYFEGGEKTCSEPLSFAMLVDNIVKYIGGRVLSCGTQRSGRRINSKENAAAVSILVSSTKAPACCQGLKKILVLHLYNTLHVCYNVLKLNVCYMRRLE